MVAIADIIRMTIKNILQRSRRSFHVVSTAAIPLKVCMLNAQLKSFPAIAITKVAIVKKRFIIIPKNHPAAAFMLASSPDSTSGAGEALVAVVEDEEPPVAVGGDVGNEAVPVTGGFALTFFAKKEKIKQAEDRNIRTMKKDFLLGLSIRRD